MASSNIKLFDENKGNMLTDTEFNISTQRLNGLQTGVASSQLQNKAMYQASLVAYAIAQIMMQNGLNANDTDAVSAFVANLSSAMLQKVYDLASTEEAQAGTNNTKWMSPALVKAAIDALAAKAQNILSDATKTLYGLSSSAVPDDLFKTLGAELRVTADANAIVTASKNDASISATADGSGLAVLKIPTFGTWTVSATINGIPVSTDYDIKAIAQYEFALSTDLENATWGIVDSISKSGNAASLWSVGDKKTVNIDGTDYQFQIIGFNHDDKTAGGKAGITFQMVDCLNRNYQMNSTATNVGGWESSAMRTSTLNSIFSSLPADLQKAIKPVNKLTSAGNKSVTINTTSDKLFLLSQIEIFGYASITGEGSQYDWYKAGNTRVKKVDGSANRWWSRSPVKDYNNLFTFVENNGEPSGNPADHWYGVAFGFCV